jgi:hypothetical protein
MTTITLDQIKTIQDVESLRSFLIEALELTELKDEQLTWLNALWEASSVYELRLKDIASLFLDGIEPMNTLEAVNETLDTMKQDGEYEYVNALLYYVQHIVVTAFGKYELRSHLEELIEQYEEKLIEQYEES